MSFPEIISDGSAFIGHASSLQRLNKLEEMTDVLAEIEQKKGRRDVGIYVKQSNLPSKIKSAAYIILKYATHPSVNCTIKGEGVTLSFFYSANSRDVEKRLIAKVVIRDGGIEVKYCDEEQPIVAGIKDGAKIGGHIDDLIADLYSEKR